MSGGFVVMRKVDAQGWRVVRQELRGVIGGMCGGGGENGGGWNNKKRRVLGGE